MTHIFRPASQDLPALTCATGDVRHVPLVLYLHRLLLYLA